jgi:Protein of unknown function (DUF2817)
MTSDVIQYFADHYGEARRRFVEACQRAGAEMDRFENPKTAPDGGPLTMDLAWFGPRRADRLLVVLSGTHGVEGLSGSACQLGWVESGGYRHVPDGVAVLLLHAINPFGVAWLQRETEEGVDVNRNFIDHAAGHPAAPLYGEIHDALMCAELDGDRFHAAEAKIAEFRARHGLEGYVRTLFGGQYTWPNGMNYGGLAPVWAHRTFIDALTRYAGSARHVVQLDFHTGLGPYAHATPVVFCGRAHPTFKRASAWFGPTVFAVGTDDSSPIQGHTGSGCIRALPKAVVTPVTVEFGTYDMEHECRVAQRDLWLRNHGNRDTDIGRQIKKELLEYFHPRDANWRELVWYRSRQLIRDAINGLAQEG